MIYTYIYIWMTCILYIYMYIYIYIHFDIKITRYSNRISPPLSYASLLLASAARLLPGTVILTGRSVTGCSFRGHRGRVFNHILGKYAHLINTYMYIYIFTHICIFLKNYQLNMLVFRGVHHPEIQRTTHSQILR